MKGKILVVPTIIVIIMALSIWLVYPAYSNGKNGVKEKYSQLKKEQKKLSNAQNKDANIQKLFGKLNSLSSQKDILYKFIPKNAKEEEIIDNLNFLASSAGLTVININLNQSKQNVSSIEENESADSASTLPLVRNLKVDMTVTGKYEAIKQFISSVEKLDRYNNVIYLEITKIVTVNNSGENTNSSAENALSAKMSLNFNVLKSAELSDDNINNPVFITGKLDTKILSEIKKAKSVNTLKLNVGQKGKTNPFLP